MEPTYDVDYFIKNFEAIPEDKWFIGNFNSPDNSKSCALGHCGIRGEKVNSLLSLFTANNLNVAIVNDGSISPFVFFDKEGLCKAKNSKKYFHLPTPKQRILAALYDIKAKQQPKVQERTVYVVVSEKIREQTKELILN